MTLLELKSLKGEALEALEGDGWTIESLAVATVKDLVICKGVGRVEATKIIAEAAEMLNKRGAEDAARLATEHYYQKTPSAKILKDWEHRGLSNGVVALTTARALAALKGIGEPLAMRLISEAQDIVNRRGLYQSCIATPGNETRQTNPAFDVRWLSGEVTPPPMSSRIWRNFERAREEYKAANG